MVMYKCPSQHTESDVGALHLHSTFSYSTMEELLEWRDGWSNSVCWTQGIVLRLGWGEADVGTVGGASTRTVREVGSELYIVVASSSEYLRLFIKWRGLREGDTAATVRFSTKPQ